MIYILDLQNDQLVKAEIVVPEPNEIPLKKDGWNFNWRELSKEINSRIFILRSIGLYPGVEGALQLKTENEMLVMNVLEIAPHNIGRKSKKYDYVAGCLIAFACKESFKLKSDYKEFLTFMSKTSLIKWYSEKYGASVGLGQRMYIDSENGLKLINEYLERKY
ncbi:hypothetical protein [Geofilum rubicundum]|uniref:Uncharacterized protein n=1 Tax=Geofilum rubicundum JCM 15548 TaxID=1236989 RepID=A0A0E9M2J2_9BACT|nr:hypothetical protein [Geofilum rubicundum]GAO31350.1 hypothetical protein JCM15548_13702 [Geofilum rubicundum JCM 15548]